MRKQKPLRCKLPCGCWVQWGRWKNEDGIWDRFWNYRDNKNCVSREHDKCNPNFDRVIIGQLDSAPQPYGLKRFQLANLIATGYAMAATFGGKACS